MIKITKRQKIIVIALILLIQLVVFMSLGTLYMVDKNRDSPFEVKFSSKGRLRWIGFDGPYLNVPHTLFKDYTDSCTVIFHPYENKRIKFIEYKVKENGHYTFIKQLSKSHNIVIADSSQQFLYYISPSKDTTLYSYEFDYLTLKLYNASDLINN